MLLKRASKLALEGVAVLVAGLAVLLVLAAVRLSYGPVRLDFLTPYIERGLSSDDGAYKVSVGRTVLTWAGWERTVDVQLTNVSVTGPDGNEKAFVPELAVGFSVRALLNGRVAPKQLDLFGPRLRVVRLPDGSLTLGQGVQPALSGQPGTDVTVPLSKPQVSRPEGGKPRVAGGEEAAQFAPDLMTQVLRDLADTKNHEGPLGYLSSISLLNADFVFEDQREAITLRAPGSDIVLTRDADGLGVNARLNVATGGSHAVVRVAGSYNAASALADLEVRMNGLEPASLAPLAPVLRPLEGVKVPISGSVEMRGNLSGTLQALSVDLTADKGTVAANALLEAPLAVRSAHLQAKVSDNLNKLVIEAFTADLGGPRIAVSGSGIRDGNKVSLDLDFGGRDIATSDLKRLWPKGMASGGRDWVVANVEKGRATNLRAKARITAEMGANGIDNVALAKLDGGFDYSGISLHFLRPLPPVTDVAGHAKLSPASITFQTTAGHLGALKVQEGHFRVDGLDKKDQSMEIEAVASGPIADAVALLNHPRLDLVKGLGLSPSRIKGVAATRVRLKFPLEKDLTFDDMDIAAASNLRDAAMPGVALGNDLTDGDLTLQLDKRGMDVSGKATLGGVPVNLKWTENFTKDVLYRARYHITGIADDAARKTFGFDFLNTYVQGPVGADLILTRYDSNRMVLAASLDLKRTTLDVPEIGWHKVSDIAGFARFNLAIENEKARSISDIAIRAGNLSAAGRATFAGDGKSISAFEFPELRFGETDLAASGSFRPDGGLDLSLSGKKADIRYFLHQKDQGPPHRPLDIRVDLGQVRAAPNAVVSNVKGRLVRDASDWQSVDVKGTVGKDKPLTLSIVRDGNKRKLHITSSDAGAALKAFDITENMVGGTLNIAGDYDDTMPKSPLTGHFGVRNFQMVKAPALAKLLSVASLTGLFDALTGQGISFSRCDVPFVKTGEQIVLKDARAYGSALGFTAEGDLDLDKDTLDMRGTVVPAYTLNSFFGDIPILGRILVPEKGSGLFAATYSMKGAIENPDVSVNPLATLTPGFLRGLFNIFDAPQKKNGDTGGETKDTPPTSPDTSPGPRP